MIGSSSQEHEEQSPETEHSPLYFFFNLETTGPSPLEDHAIEIAATTAATAAGITQQQKSFSRLILTTRPITHNGI